MAVDEITREESKQSRKRNDGEEFWGDLERRRPTKRRTTVRPFGIVRNWSERNTLPLKKRSRKNGPSVQSTKVSSRIEISPPKVSPSSSQASHEPLSFYDMHPISTDDDDANDSSPQQGSKLFHSNLQSSLPGGATANITALDSDDDDDDDDMITQHKNTPEQSQATPEDGLQSGPLSKTTRKPARRRVVEFLFNEKKDKYEDVDEEEYEAHNFVRLFDADRGRKRSATDVIDLDIILTNVEEIALEIKNEQDSPLSKKAIREVFIQLRQTFSDSIDVYKEKKYLKSASTKANSRIKKMKQELIKLQSKRTRTRNKLEKLQSEYEELEKQRKGKKDAHNFLYEFERLQDRLRKSKIIHNQKEHHLDNNLPSLLSEASGYLTIPRQLKDINDKLQLWLDKNKS